MYKRQIAKAGIYKKEWIACLINLMLIDMINIITRKNNNKIYDYDCIKEFLLK